MIDTLLKQRPNFLPPCFWNEKKLKTKSYFVITLHRPANVDQEYKLKLMINEIISCSKDKTLIFPVHPRTAKILQKLEVSHPRLQLVEPLPYLEFNYLVESAFAVITDSGGITEETTIMGIPCLTIRDNTERPETITMGTNELIGTDPKKLAPHMNKLFEGNWKKGSIPPMWDGRTSERIVDILISL